ncbi:MAG: hypothetical protein EON55_07355 [Alphaproteobacteria bacterium]|nr:MAG: hypothetical protein EON55_07355 [Alphaproteobacteria bacterium]
MRGLQALSYVGYWLYRSRQKPTATYYPPSSGWQKEPDYTFDTNHATKAAEGIEALSVRLEYTRA